MKERINRLREKITEAGLDGFLVMNPANRYYLSGFTGTAGILVVTALRAVLLTDFRYAEQARSEAADFEVLDQESPWEKKFHEILQDSKAAKVGFAQEHLTVSQFNGLKDKIPDVEFVPLPDLVTKLRARKDEGEIEAIKKAANLADEAFAHIAQNIAPGQKEIEVALEMEFFMRRGGAQKAAFDFIVASGVRSSLPHGVASSKKLEKGDLVTMDYGCLAGWYNSDMTRTVVLGKASPQQKTIYNIVLQAQMAAIEAVAPGKRCCDLDKLARDIIAKAGYGEYFGHSLGHGVGLAVHEEPALSVRDETILEPGMVVTVEPGIYLPDWGGVRIEDMVLVTEAGHEVLTRSPKELMEI